ncbi:MAG: hypothetical protein H0T46_12205, partial [Deltaproteobacteria bacterium]|nr:hypothetical protein [Deltaproteobacteria bacterium]
MRRLGVLVACSLLGVIATACGFEAPHNADGEVVTVGFLSNASLQDEASGTVGISVGLDGVADQLVSVRYRFTGGTAKNGVDYNGSDNLLTIPPGAIEAKIPVTIHMDGEEEAAETIQIVLSDASSAVIGNGTHTVTISRDILPRVKFEAATSTADEATSPVLAVSLDVASPIAVSVDYVVTGTASGGGTDYTLDAGTVTFPPGNTKQQLALPISDDALDEFDENVLVTLTSSEGVVVGATASHDHQITDNDNPPLVSFATATQSRQENGTNVTLMVTLSGPSAKPIQVDVNPGPPVVTGATPLVDYLFPQTRTLSIAPGATAAMLSVLLVDDQTDEEDEDFTAVLAVQSGYNVTLGPTATNVITITDNDDPPTVEFQTNSGAFFEQDEGFRDIAFRVVLSRASAKPITVPIAFTGDATNPGDYIVAGNPITINPGQTVGDVTIRIVGDRVKEPASGGIKD